MRGPVHSACPIYIVRPGGISHIMRTKRTIALYGLVGAFALTGVVGCSRSDTVAEGVIYSVTLQGGDSFTRVNDPKCVPGGSGSWNVDAYGRLTHDFLIITKPHEAGFGAQVIPASRVINIQFGDGGITEVAKQPNPGK